MGNKVSVEKNGSRRSGGQRLAPAHLQDNNVSRFGAKFRRPELQDSLESGEKHNGEKPHKAEANTRHHHDPDIKAAQDQGRQLEQQTRSDLQLREARAREEQQLRGNEEARIERQHQEHKLRVLRERERRREEEAAPPALCLSLPGACRHHNTRRGCDDPRCRRLHVCRPFLAAICNYGVTCRYGHSLTTAHNLDICGQYNLDTTRELVMLQQLRRAYEESGEMTETMLKNNLQICFKVASKNCDWHRCNRIHICRQFVAGHCARTDCKSGHELRATHNSSVLRRHRMTELSDHEILHILRLRDKRRPQPVNRAAATASSAKNGAIPRHQTSDGADTSKLTQPSKTKAPSQSSQAMAGLSDELQCPICLELFRRATTLGCGHTFCAECLQEVRVKNGDKCALCCASISSFTRSVTLDNIIRGMTAKQ